MQRLIFKPAHGVANALEALSIIRHFEREYGRDAFMSIKSLRDAQTKRHLGYLMIDVDPTVATHLLDRQPHYVRSMRPNGYNEANGPFEPLKYKITLQDVINSVQLERKTAADKPSAEENEKILQISIEPATRGSFESPRPIKQKRGDLPGQLRVPPPLPSQLEDLLILFDGFASPGRLRAGWRKRVQDHQQGDVGQHA